MATALAPDLPDPDPDLTTYCPDPGVNSVNTVDDAVGVIGENRLYAACQRKKQRDWIAFYRNVQSGFEGDASP